MGFDFFVFLVFLVFRLRRGVMAPAVWFFMPSRGGVLLRALFGLFGFALAFAGWCLLRTRFGCFAFALASAICYLASSVAPVRGGTYFSLPPCTDWRHR
ncbi:hypothetical protein [Paraburkholderia terrae]